MSWPSSSNRKFCKSANDADARRQAEELAESLGNALDAASVFREFLKKRCISTIRIGRLGDAFKLN
jgi:hypothetical protein